MVDIYTTKGKMITGTRKEFYRNMKTADGETAIDKLVVFTNLFDKNLLTLSALVSRKRHDAFYTGVKPNHPEGQAKLEAQSESAEYIPHVLIIADKAWAAGKTKEEIYEKYSEVFDPISDKKLSFRQKQKNIESGSMTPETKERKINELENTIQKLIKELGAAYKEYRQDLRTASKSSVED